MCAQLSSSADFSFLFFSGADPMWIFDIQSLDILEVNEAAIIVYGYTRAEFLSLSIKDLRSPEEIPSLEKALTKIKQGEGYCGEFLHINSSGRVMHVKVSSFTLAFAGKDACLVTVNNIDELKAISNKLEQVENRLEKILDTTTIGFFQLDRDSNITYWNRAAEDMLSYKREYVLYENLWEVFPEAVFSESYTAINAALAGSVTVEFREYFWPIQKWFSVHVFPTAEGAIVHFRDITEKKLAVDGLHEKIRQLKEISYLNSHHIRKPLASLIGLTSLIREGHVNEAEIRQLADYIYTCSLDLDKAVREVSKKVSSDELTSNYGEMESFSFQGFVKECIRLLKPEYPGYRLLLKGQEDAVYSGNKASIRFIIEVLISNAVKFSPAGSRIIVKTDIINDNLVLAIKDFGQGMNEEELNTLFLNLIKRKVETSLLKVNDIVTRHNGSIWVESEAIKGTTFFVRFPLSSYSAIKEGREVNFSNQPGLDIVYNSEGYLWAKWYSFHSFHTIKAGCLQLVDAIRKYKCTRLLNDNSHLMGSWEAGAGWVDNELSPMLIKAGLKYIAWIYSPSTFSKMATDHTAEVLKGDIVINTFDNRASGLKWLKEV